MSREPLGIRASAEFVELLTQAGEERTGSLIALAVIGAAQVGFSLDGIYEDIAAAIASPLEQPVRDALIQAFRGEASTTSVSTPAPLVKRRDPPDDSGDAMELLF